MTSKNTAEQCTANDRILNQDWLALALLLFYVIIFATLTIRQHEAFHTRALDLAKFDQSIWNTAQGRPFAITIGESLVLDSHFSPALALYAPLYWLWSDVRILFVAQSLLLGGAGLLIYWHFRRTLPWLGLIVFAAYLMHPMLHQVNLVEFRRNTMAVFAISYALYHLLRRQYGWMALGLLLALLSKEDLSLIVAAFGLTIMVVQKNWRVGALTLVSGLAWALIVPFYVLPALNATGPDAGYQHAASRYGYLGASLPQIVRTVAADPAIIFSYVVRPARLRAVFDFLWPTAFLGLLAPGVLLLLGPTLFLLLASTSNTIGRLEAWYPAVLLVILYWAVGVGVARLPRPWRRWALPALLLAGLAGWFSSSQLWPGPKFDPARYVATAHDAQVAGVLREIPPQAIVMAQDALVPHLSHREQIYVLPWARGGNLPEYVAFDHALGSYPLEEEAYRTVFNDYLAGLDYELAAQVDTFFLFRHAGTAAPEQEMAVSWPVGLRLNGLSVAAAPPGMRFGAPPVVLPAGTELRVALFWEVTQKMDQNLTVFVHILGADGHLLGQHDGWPADAHRPTAVLPPGTCFRDIHYLTLNEETPAGDLQLRLGLYEGLSGTAVPDSEGREGLTRPLMAQ